MREFVYLDEVSVYSLLASRLGPLAAEFTDTQTRSLSNESAAGLSGQVWGVGGEASTRTVESQGASSQVLRKSTIQASFKEFFDIESERVRLKAAREPTGLPSFRSWEEVVNFASSAQNQVQQFVWRPGELARGETIECEVSIKTDPIYRFTTIFSSMADIIQDSPEFFPQFPPAVFAQAAGMNRIVDKLLVGLIPLRATALDFVSVTDGFDEYVVDRRAVADGISGCQAIPLELVGVTERTLYWKDISRVLFSNQSFRLMARVSVAGLQHEWKAIKLADLLSEAVPTLARDMQASSQQVISALSGGAPQTEPVLARAVVDYAERLAERTGQCLLPATSTMVAALAAGFGAGDDETVEFRRSAFGAVTALVCPPGVQLPPPEELAERRWQALALAERAAPVQDGPQATPAVERLLEVEFVAI